MAIQHFTDLTAALCEFSRHLFAVRGARQITVDNQLATIKRAEGAGIRKRVCPHLLRHSLATNLMHSGTGILAIKQQMGHGHLTTTMRYLHGDPERLKQEFLVHVLDYLSPKIGDD